MNTQITLPELKDKNLELRNAITDLLMTFHKETGEVADLQVRNIFIQDSFSASRLAKIDVITTITVTV